MDNSYLYIIVYKPTGEYYIGSRYAKNIRKRPSEDFLQDYFTSSTIVRRMLVHNSITDFEWVLIPIERERAAAVEQKLINECYSDMKCWNGHSKKTWQRKDWREKQIAKKADPDYRRIQSEKNKALWTPERRAEWAARTRAQMTPERREYLSKKTKAQMTPEARAHLSKKAAEQAARKRNAS